MTPTTVDAKIVAAAANAGHWAELAGGGQVTEPIFDARVAELTAAARAGPRRPVQHAVPRPVPVEAAGRRKALGAEGPSVRRPDRRRGRQRRHPRTRRGRRHHRGAQRRSASAYVCFKPGTVEQIKSVIKIAAEVPDRDVIVHIEGGRAGGHHSWEDLDDLLVSHLRRPAQAAPTSPSASAAASAPPSGPPSTCPAAGRRPTASRSCRSTASWSAPPRWPRWRPPPRPRSSSCWSTPPAPTQWVGAGKAQGGMASGRSQLGADIHEIDNAASRCGRLLDDVAGDADAVAERRDEIIAAMADTAKPYFGDVADMTYLQWLQRYVELAIGDGDSTADTKQRRFAVARRQLARPLRGDAQARRGAAAPAGLRPDRDPLPRRRGR